MVELSKAVREKVTISSLAFSGEWWRFQAKLRLVERCLGGGEHFGGKVELGGGRNRPDRRWRRRARREREAREERESGGGGGRKMRFATVANFI